jgi:hypothetical protein
VRPSKIASSLLRSAVRTPKLSFSELRIESSGTGQVADLVGPGDFQRHVEGAGGHLAAPGPGGDAVGESQRRSGSLARTPNRDGDYERARLSPKR